MTTLREIVAARAKIPAKIHSMEAHGGYKEGVSTPKGGPLVVEYSAKQVTGDPGGANSNPPRPPRAPGNTSPNGSGSGAPNPKRAPKSSSESRSGSIGRRSPSEPPVQNGTDNSERRASTPKAKARASSANRIKIGDSTPPIDRKELGKVPAYLKRRQEEMAEEKRVANRPLSPQAPPGYRKVPDSEKEATLEVLRARKKEVEAAQRNLPFKIETLGQKQREKDLSDRLTHMDKLLGMFGQPVVFIPADAEPIGVTVPPLPQGLQGRPPRERDDDRSSPEVGRECHALEMRHGREGERTLEDLSVRPASRESRARAIAEKRAQVGMMAPWDRGPPSPSVRSDVHTSVQVAAPPGGKSSLSLGWD